MDREKVIKGFTVCSEHGLLNGEDCHGHYEYTDNLADIIKANDYSKQCPYNGCKTGCVKTLARDVLSLLKEQEAVVPYKHDAVWLCGNCENEKIGWDDPITCDEIRYPFCRKCGRPVKWK